VIRGLPALLGALLSVALPAISLAQVDEPRGPAMDIAPIEADVEAMRRTLQSLEALVDERRGDRIDELISPGVSEPQRRAIVQAAADQIASMPAGARFAMRTDIGRGAVVPVGPERVQVQVTCDVGAGAARRSGRVDLQLQAVERGGRRQWLLTEVVFPGQRPILTGGLPTGPVIALVGALTLPLLALALWLWRKSRRARAERRAASSSPG
jgi:hypothetical protein